jgi:hypothetical protein
VKTLVAWWREKPSVRMAARNLAVAVASYIAGGLVSGFSDWRAFAASAITTTVTTVLGLTTPLEPFVGIGKVDRVEVPVPPAAPDR